MAGPVAAAGPVSAAFDLKNTTLPLLQLQLKSHDLAALAAELEARRSETPHLFLHDPLVVDLSALRELEEAAIDFPALAALLREHRLQPVAVANGNASQLEAALEAGLPEAPEPPAPKPRPVREVEVVKEVVREVVKEVPVAANTLVIDKPQSPAFLLTVDLDKRMVTVRMVAAKRMSDKTYQLWMATQPGQPPSSLGLINNDEFTVREALAGYDPAVITNATYGISLEPLGGSPTGQPTSPAIHAKLLQVTAPQ